MLEGVLEIQNPHWGGSVYSGLFQRGLLPQLIKKLVLKEIQILLGVRRSGKSTLFKLLINHLMISGIDPKSILYLNLDDPVFVDLWKSPKELYKMIETAEKLTGVKSAYLFLDEIQNINMWEKFVKSIYDTEYVKKIFITGSNSSLLMNHYATLLSGRYLIDYVMPFSFKEVIVNAGINSQLDLVRAKAKILRMQEQLLFYGGFPQVWKTEDPALRREQLLGYFETIVLKDCISHNKVRETKKFQALALYLLTNNASLYSYNGLAEVMDSNENTIKQFIHILQESFLLDELNQFSFSLKKQIKSKKKNYCVDNGLIHAVSMKFSENKGRLFENLVYTELKKSGYQEIFFFNDQKECDFIIKTTKKIIAVQATYELTNENYDREVNGILSAMQQLSVDKAFIITFDGEEKTIHKNIEVVPFWKFFFHATK